MTFRLLNNLSHKKTWSISRTSFLYKTIFISLQLYTVACNEAVFFISVKFIAHKDTKTQRLWYAINNIWHGLIVYDHIPFIIYKTYYGSNWNIFYLKVQILCDSSEDILDCFFTIFQSLQLLCNSLQFHHSKSNQRFN